MVWTERGKSTQNGRRVMTAPHTTDPSAVVGSSRLLFEEDDVQVLSPWRVGRGRAARIELTERLGQRRLNVVDLMDGSQQAFDAPYDEDVEQCFRWTSIVGIGCDELIVLTDAPDEPDLLRLPIGSVDVDAGADAVANAEPDGS